jgi:hypothetical protein
MVLWITSEMAKWRVQAAWAGGLHDPAVHWDEEDAKYDVERLFRTWTLKGLRTLAIAQGNPWLYQILNSAAERISELLDAGDVWGAYDYFHEIQDQLNRVFSTGKAWYHMGTIIVEAPEGQGPKIRKRLLTPEDFPKR